MNFDSVGKMLNDPQFRDAGNIARRFNTTINTRAEKVTKHVKVFFNNASQYIKNLTNIF